MAEITMGQLASLYAEAAGKVEPTTQHNLQVLSQIGVGLVKSTIQEMGAVDLGTMLNSTTAERENANTYLIGPTVDYAVYVALGTSKMDARPFHTVAAERLNEQAKHVGFKPEDIGL